MRLITKLIIALILLTATCATAQELHLKDGTILKGTLLSFDQGVYTFSSSALGTMNIPASKVSALTTGEGQSPAINPQNMQTLQEQMMGDNEIMALIESLQNDPDFLAIMQDPEIITAIQNGDYKGLETNPKMMKLMEKSQVKAIKRKVDH